MGEIRRTNRELKYKARIIDIYEDEMITDEGHVHHWDFVHHRMGAAAILPVLSDGRIILVRQYRNAVDDYLLEIPAGCRDSLDEEPIVCAFRELEEETGYRSSNLTHLLTLHLTPAYLDETLEIYLARDLVPSRQNLDDGEFIEVEYYTLEEAVRMVLEKEIRDSKTAAAVLAYYAMKG